MGSTYYKSVQVGRLLITSETVPELWRFDTATGEIDIWDEMIFDVALVGSGVDSLSSDALKLLFNGSIGWSPKRENWDVVDAGFVELINFIKRHNRRINP